MYAKLIHRLNLTHTNRWGTVIKTTSYADSSHTSSDLELIITYLLFFPLIAVRAFTIIIPDLANKMKGEPYNEKIHAVLHFCTFMNILNPQSLFVELLSEEV